MTHKACKSCSKEKVVPQPCDVPEPLRAISDKREVEALRPVDMHLGPEERAKFGYRVHTSMCRFSWSEARGSLTRLPELPKKKPA